MNGMSKNGNIEISSTECTQVTEGPLKPAKLKSKSDSVDKHYEIHPEISLEQIQKSRGNLWYNKRQAQKKLLLMETENGQISSSLITASDMNASCHTWQLEAKENKTNIDSEIPSDLLELNTMFNFAPGSHCVIRKTSKKGCQRRNSTIACSLGSKIGTRSRKIGDEVESINNRRRLSVASMAFPVQKEERRQRKPVYERLTMIESVDNEGGFSSNN